jgi:hypothetical protein
MAELNDLPSGFAFVFRSASSPAFFRGSGGAMLVGAGGAAPPVVERHASPTVALFLCFPHRDLEMLSIYRDYLASFGDFCGELSPIIPT